MPISSLEFVIQPAAKNPVGEMGVGGDLSPTHTKVVDAAGSADINRAGATRRAAGGAEVAKVHVKSFNFPSSLLQRL